MDQITILSYGLSFDLGPSNDCLLDFLTNFAKFEYMYNHNDDLGTFKVLILSNIISQINKPNELPQRLLNALSYLKNNNDLLIGKDNDILTLV